MGTLGYMYKQRCNSSKLCFLRHKIASWFTKKACLELLILNCHLILQVQLNNTVADLRDMSGYHVGLVKHIKTYPIPDFMHGSFSQVYIFFTFISLTLSLPGVTRREFILTIFIYFKQKYDDKTEKIIN